MCSSNADSSSRFIEEYVFAHGEYLIGRFSQCDIRLEDPLVSRVHPQLVFGDSGLSVLDMGSSNGTFLNGTRIDTSQDLQEAVLSIGNTKLIVSVVPPEPCAFGGMSQLRVMVSHSITYEECRDRDKPGFTEFIASSDQVGGTSDGRLSRIPGTDRFRAEPETDGGGIGTTSRSDPLRGLVIGTWVQFDPPCGSDVKQILCLKAIGGQGHIYFFYVENESENGETFSITADRLSRCMRDGSAKIVSR